MPRAPSLFNCLIRTHHITSRKKLQRVRRAAGEFGVDWLLIRSGGSPGLMFAESSRLDRLEHWVAAVQNLRYKDFQCAQKPAPSASASPVLLASGFKEVGVMADFGSEMELRGLTQWWHKAMGY